MFPVCLLFFRKKRKMYNMVNTNRISEHKVYLSRKDEEQDFSYKTYDRNHLLQFGRGTLVKASAALDYLGKAELVNPEEAFAASLAS
jgi:hypothetical protein